MTKRYSDHFWLRILSGLGIALVLFGVDPNLAPSPTMGEGFRAFLVTMLAGIMVVTGAEPRIQRCAPNRYQFHGVWSWATLLACLQCFGAAGGVVELPRPDLVVGTALIGTFLVLVLSERSAGKADMRIVLGLLVGMLFISSVPLSGERYSNMFVVGAICFTAAALWHMLMVLSEKDVPSREDPPANVVPLHGNMQEA